MRGLGKKIAGLFPRPTGKAFTWFLKSIPAPAKNIYNQQPLRME